MDGLLVFRFLDWRVNGCGIMGAGGEVFGSLDQKPMVPSLEEVRNCCEEDEREMVLTVDLWP